MKTITSGLLFVLGFLFLYPGFLYAHTQPSLSSVTSYTIGDVVDNFTLPSATGDSISLYDYRSDIVLIHIWNSG